MLKHGILGLLNYSSMSGYDIMLIFRDSLNYFWSANTSQIYRELQTLKNKHYVQVNTIQQSGKPDKKIYSITDSGKEELNHWLKEDIIENNNSTLCMKTFFSSLLTRDENIERFQKLKEENKQTLDKYTMVESIIDAYAKVINSQKDKVYWDMTLDYGKKYCLMLDDWYSTCIDKLKEMEEV